jgi:hypothetical protein
MSLAFLVSKKASPRLTFWLLSLHLRAGPLYPVLFQAVALVEAIHAPASINQFLLARKEWVAFGTNFNLDVLTRRTGNKRFAAGARDRTRVILGMYACLHLHSPLFLGRWAAPRQWGQWNHACLIKSQS